MPPAAAPIVPLDAEAQQRVATSIDLVHWVLNRRFYGWLDHFEDELFAAGIDGVCRAAQLYDPSRGFQWSSYAVKSIWSAVSRHLERHLIPWAALHRIGGARYYFGDVDEETESQLFPRDVPTSIEWHCIECRTPIDWDENRKIRGHRGDRANMARNLCGTCDRARIRARDRGFGQGICARCAGIIGSRITSRRYYRDANGKRRCHTGYSEPYCRCYPEPPALTWEER